MAKRLISIVLLILTSQSPASAQEAIPTPSQVQEMISVGHSDTALSYLKTILQDNPKSGVALFLEAEAEDAMGNSMDARQSLSLAEKYAPGLPFASSWSAAQLAAHIKEPPANCGTQDALKTMMKGIQEVVAGTGSDLQLVNVIDVNTDWVNEKAGSWECDLTSVWSRGPEVQGTFELYLNAIGQEVYVWKARRNLSPPTN